MEVNDSCPSRERLTAFRQGKLSSELVEAIGRHLAVCSPCAAVLTTLEDECDTIVAKLRRFSPALSWAEDPILERIEARAKAIMLRGTSDLGQTGTDEYSPPAVSPTGPLPGPLGPYQLLRKLGQGGMGSVYEAVHTRLHKRVAVKVLPEWRVSDPQALARFSREMATLGGLAHPNIVSATDAGEAGGHHYLVMEYVDGLNLSALVSRCGPLSHADAAEIIRQAANGLQYAHEHGRVHRDIKTANLMLSATGEVKILDLGLALLREGNPVGEELTLTSGGQIMGTADYMAPEQWLDSHHVDIRADIYSLGCALYKLLTGKAPFSGSSYDSPSRKRRAHLDAPVPPIVNRHDLPGPFLDVLTRMLAKEPDLRYPTPAAVAEALQPFTAGCDLRRLLATARDMPAKERPEDLASPDEALDLLPLAARPQEAPAADAPVENESPAGPPWYRRSRFWRYGLLATALAGAAVLTAVFWPRPPQTQEPQPPRTARPDEWQALPQGAPSALLWPRAAQNSRWDWNPQQKELYVTCNREGFVRLGEASRGDYQFEVSFYQTQWGGAGIFFGFQPDKLRGKPCQKYQVIHLHRTLPPAKPQGFSLIWTVSQTWPEGGGVHSDAVRATVPEFGDQDQRLSIAVEGGILRSVRWNGVELMPLFRASAEGRGLVRVSDSCSGVFGVYCGSSSVFFRNPRFCYTGGS
jgi:serine/threonine protein kinase